MSSLAVPRGRGARPRGGLRRHQTKWAFIFLAPALVLFGLTVFYPMARALQYSLYKWPLGGAKEFVGLDNYRRLLFDDSGFRQSVEVTLYFTVLSVLPTILLALVVAVLLNDARLRARGLFRTIYFVPVVTSLVAVGYVWKALLEPSFGLVNTVLGWVGISGPGWLASPDWALDGIVLMTVWRDLGSTWWCSWPASRRSRATSWTRRGSTAPAPGNGSGTSPCRCSTRASCSPP